MYRPFDPGDADVVDEPAPRGIAVAIDGQIFQDSLFEPIGPDSEVFLLPQIAGGSTPA